MQLPEIPEAGTPLPDWQNYVAQHVKARGWDSASDLEIFLLFSEEVGELAKALRRHRGLFSESAHSNPDRQNLAQQQVGEEMADVLSYLLDLASRLDVDLEKAFREKERLNRSREWD